MFNVEASIFSLSIDKTAKKRRKRSKQVLAHTLPKEATEAVRNEKGVSKHFLFVGVDVNGASDGSRGANALPSI